MHGNQWRAERERLANLLESYESGRIAHLDEDATGQLRRDTAPERIASLKERIAYLDDKLAKDAEG